jgi:hypothetical protein
MYNNQQGVTLSRAMQPGQAAVAQMQPGFGNQQFGLLPPASMPGMQFPGMQHPQMYGGSQPAMMHPQQMPGAQYGAMAQQQPMYGGRLAGYMQHPAVAAAHYYNQGTSGMYGYPGANDLSQRMYGLSVQDNSYMGMSSSYQTAPSPAPSTGQPMRPTKPEDKLFGDLLSIAKSAGGLIYCLPYFCDFLMFDDHTLVTLFECISFWFFFSRCDHILIPLDSLYHVHVPFTLKRKRW